MKQKENRTRIEQMTRMKKEKIRLIRKTCAEYGRSIRVKYQRGKRV